MTKESGSRVGIDIGNCAIKILQVSGPAEKPIVTGIGFRDIGGLPEAEIPNALKSLAAESRITSKSAAVSVSGPSVIVRFISLPKMDDASLKGAIRYEAEKFIPYNIGDCVIDFQTLDKEDKDNKLSILLVAAKKEYVGNRISIIEKSGFSVRLVDVDSFAIANVFLANQRSLDKDRSYAILNVGGVHTNLSILKGGVIYFARDIALGGNDFTIAIARRFGVDQKAAEEMKLRPPADKSNDISDCVKSSLGDLFDEIKLSFGYYENQAGKGIDEVYISGGTADMAGFEQAFEDALGSKPISWNPMGFMNVSSAGAGAELAGKMKNSFAIAAGLVLR